MYESRAVLFGSNFMCYGARLLFAPTVIDSRAYDARTIALDSR